MFIRTFRNSQMKKNVKYFVIIIIIIVISIKTV